MEQNQSSSLFSMGSNAQERDLSYVPQLYVITNSHRACLTPQVANVPVIDMDALRNDSIQRSPVLEEIRDACSQVGFFQIVNHGIKQSVLDEAMSAASKFFDLSTRKKATCMSNNVYKPVRYGTSFKDGVDRIQFWRIFLKHYAHPLEDWIHM